MTPIESSFIADVIANPDDDTVRLIYADWLEDNGRPERAEFIRVQCELERTDECATSRRENWAPFTSLFCQMAPGCERCRLRRRERELLTAGAFWDWFASAPGGWLRAWPGSPAVKIDLPRCTVSYFDDRLDRQYWRWIFTVRRGFIEAVKLSAADWLTHADAITVQQPIRAVTLTTGLDWIGFRDDGKDVLAMAEIGSRARRREWYRCRRAFYGYCEGKEGSAIQHIIAVEWPGIKFTLP